jgi:hypothetical protein
MEDGLDFADERIVTAGRQSLWLTIERLAPERTLPLCCVAISGLFADMLSASSGAHDLAAVVNEQIGQAGWRLVELRNN